MMTSSLLPSLILVACLISLTVQKSLLDELFPKIISERYNNTLHEAVYRFKFGNLLGGLREEVGVVMNPGTAAEELVVIGANTFVDPNTNTELNTVFTADKRGYRSRYVFQKIPKVKHHFEDKAGSHKAAKLLTT